jgi:hypothetical protein
VPDKPQRPFISLAFSPKGKVTRRVETLPSRTEDIELTVVRKLMAVLSERKLVDVESIRKAASEPADVEVTVAGGSVIEVQVAEIVDRVSAQHKSVTDAYVAALVGQHSGLLQQFAGRVITVVTEMNAPALPRVETEPGNASLQAILDILTTEAPIVRDLPFGKWRTRKVFAANQELWLIFDVARDESAAAQLHWQPSIRSNVRTNFAAETIAGKLAKHYSKPTNRFWLVVFGTDTMPPLESSDDFSAAQSLLGSVEHPFDEVWYIWPLADQDAGAVIQLWPRLPNVSTNQVDPC